MPTELGPASQFLTPNRLPANAQARHLILGNVARGCDKHALHFMGSSSKPLPPWNLDFQWMFAF